MTHLQSKLAEKRIDRSSSDQQSKINVVIPGSGGTSLLSGPDEKIENEDKNEPFESAEKSFDKHHVAPLDKNQHYHEDNSLHDHWSEHSHDHHHEVH